MTRMRRLLRRAAYRSGGLGLMRQRRRGALTVVMFHRVVDPTDPDFAEADVENTVPTPLFEDMLGFFNDYYSVVGLIDVLAAADGTRPLPDHALLISFDDGWADNLRYAAPLLKSSGLPAVIFIAAEPVLSADDSWWQQQVFDAVRRRAPAAALGRRLNADATGAGDEAESALDIVCRLAAVTEGERAATLSSLGARPPALRMMLAPGDVARLAGFGIAVGIHGYRHLPLTRVVDLHAELRRAQSSVAALSGDKAGGCALACPHGDYDARVLCVARDVGIRLVFTSDPILNPTENGMIAADRPLGRISIEAPHLGDRFGRLDRSAAAAWLWRRPIAAARAYRSSVSAADA